ncbi:Replicase polyprotein 1ab [Asanoa iriomotensis]|uniref:Replicase polyprotein 1ab n=1 Tax=Asanoa iriomotensis TaxID=234613 RepID=UPI00194320A8|nr:Replicase polyprotein 1ab [Asanoa iriomotensis]
MARHLVATGRLIDDDPDEALAHALAARRLASRIAAVREAVGLAAYHAGEWQVAIGELRTYHRMTGRQDHLAVLADCERALGRPERAIDLYRGADRAALAPADAVELLIVAAGARGDLGQKDAAVAMLQVRELTSGTEEPWAGRLRYAYADALLAADRRDEAREWFARAAEVDEDGETDAAERLLELDGVTIEGDDQDEEDDVLAEAAEVEEADEDGDDEDDEEEGVELDSEGRADDDAAVDAEIDEDADDNDLPTADDQPVQAVTGALPEEVAADDVPAKVDETVEVDAEGRPEDGSPVDAEIDADPDADLDADDRKVLPEIDDTDDKR